jgi:hypothetical protein
MQISLIEAHFRLVEDFRTAEIKNSKFKYSQSKSERIYLIVQGM